MTQTCKCGTGKASAYDGKCGHCRSAREAKAHRKWVEDAPKREAQAEFLKRAAAASRIALDSPLVSQVRSCDPLNVNND